MAYEQRNNQASAFKNERKREGKKDPEYTGQGIIDGRPYWVDIWVNNNPKVDGYDPNKKTFLSISFREKDQRRQPPKQDGPPPQRPQSKLSQPKGSITDEHNQPDKTW